MNIWSTVGTDVPIPEETLIGMCDICLLFIETDVFGKLQIIPHAPAPRKQQYGDARYDLLAPTNGKKNRVSPPLNLSVVPPIAIGDNAKVDNAKAVAESNDESKGTANKPPEIEAKVNGGHVTPR